ncbi:MAG: ABC transporter permease subunit, partial [Pseudomonadota bacterium]
MAFAVCLAMAGAALGASSLVNPAAVQAQSAGATLRGHQGVASCAGSTCHGRSAADGTVVRQDELMRWQEDSSPTGAHSRAWRVIQEPRGQAIVRRMGLDAAGVQRECAGCHASPGAARVSDGVDCEACHGASSGWLSTHYTVGASHARILFRHLLPGFTSHIIVVLTMSVPAMILGETSLSFLGLGLRTP